MKIMGIGLMERTLHLVFLYPLDCPVLLCRNNTGCQFRNKVGFDRRRPQRICGQVLHCEFLPHRARASDLLHCPPAANTFNACPWPTHFARASQLITSVIPCGVPTLFCTGVVASMSLSTGRARQYIPSSQTPQPSLQSKPPRATCWSSKPTNSNLARASMEEMLMTQADGRRGIRLFKSARSAHYGCRRW
jgi:hypothetical protein